MKRLLLLIFICSASSLLAQQSNDEISKLRESYTKAVERATEPLKATYVAELKKLMEKHTKAGNLDAALAARNEIESISSPVAASSGPDSSRTASNAVVNPDAPKSKLSPSYKKILESYFVGKTWAVLWDERPDHRELLYFSKNGKGARKLGDKVETTLIWSIEEDGTVFVSLAGFDKHITFINAEEASMVLHYAQPKGDINQRLKISSETIEGVR